MPATHAPLSPLPPLAIRAWLRYDVVARKLHELHIETALEIGCGQGAFGARLARETTYLGVEPDQDSFAVASARIRPQGGDVLNGTDELVPAGLTYDLVCAFEVLEHLQDDERALRSWVGRVKPGGQLMLSVPAFQSRFGDMDTHAGHYRRYDPPQIVALLKSVGLVDVDVIVYGWPLGYALEAVRNRVDKPKVAATQGASPEELTAASGRTFQPTKPLIGAGIKAAVMPFRLLQRARPQLGTGLVVTATKPID